MPTQLLTDKLTFRSHLWQTRSQLSKRRRLLLPELWHVRFKVRGR